MDIHSPIIDATQAHTLDGLFRQRIRRTPAWPAFRFFDREQNSWQSLHWQAMGERVGRWLAALAQTKLRPGDRLAILLRNGPDWIAIEQAALGYGLVVVPLYLDDRPDNISFVLQDAGVKLLVVPDVSYWDKLREVCNKPLPDLAHVVLCEGQQAPTSPWEHLQLHCASTWLPATPAPLQDRNGDPHALATIVYTSGTTGRPKGVMLSHHNILYVAEGACSALGVRPQLRLLSFLPLSHMFERTAGYYVPMMYGLEVCYARSIQLLADDLLAIQPHVLIAVPRIFERFYERLQDQLAKRSTLAKLIFNLTVHIGWKRFLAQQNRGPASPLFMLWPWLQKRVAAPVANRFGGELLMAISGGAPLPPAIARLFIGLGVNVLQGYGMTECSPVVSVNRTHANDHCSVGKPLDKTVVRIGENDELQVKSPGVMLGYWNNHKATHDTIIEEGWLRTGDKARIENDFIYITGRIKDILVMSNGEKVPPVDMEEAITLDPLFTQALVIGEARSFLAVLVVLSAEHWFKFAQAQGVNPQDPEALNDPTINKALLERVCKALRGFPGYAKVRRLTALLEPWTIENGLLTPTLKTKRQKIVEQHAEQVESMYG